MPAADTEPFLVSDTLVATLRRRQKSLNTGNIWTTFYLFAPTSIFLNRSQSVPDLGFSV